MSRLLPHKNSNHHGAKWGGAGFGVVRKPDSSAGWGKNPQPSPLVGTIANQNPYAVLSHRNNTVLSRPNTAVNPISTSTDTIGKDVPDQAARTNSVM